MAFEVQTHDQIAQLLGLLPAERQAAYFQGLAHQEQIRQPILEALTAEVHLQVQEEALALHRVGVIRQDRQILGLLAL
jgi:cell division FtsZ-interacting protein ZapD